MHRSTKPVVTFDLPLMRFDCTRKGWDDQALAREIVDNEGCSLTAAKNRVSRFFNGSFQTTPSAVILARALGKPVSRYVIAPDHQQRPRKPRYGGAPRDAVAP